MKGGADWLKTQEYNKWVVTVSDWTMRKQTRPHFSLTGSVYKIKVKTQNVLEKHLKHP